MRILLTVISLVMISCSPATQEAEARGGCARAAHAPVFYKNGSAGIPTPGAISGGSNGHAYRPVQAGYWGRRYRGRGGGAYWGYNPDLDNNTQRSYKPVDDKYDEWNRSEIRRLGALPKSAFVQEYNWPSRPDTQLAAGKSRQFAARSDSTVH